jgi:four helix bundle protein
VPTIEKHGAAAHSTAELVSKIQDGLQELEETAYWLELLQASCIASSDVLSPIIKEADQLVAIFVTAVKTAKQRIPSRDRAHF